MNPPVLVTGPAQPVPARPLLLTTDPDLLDDGLRLAVAAGVDLHVETEPAAARAAWARAPLVLVGADVAALCGRAALPRRSGVLLVGLDLDDADVWRQAVEIGAGRVVFLPDAESWIVERLAEAVEGDARPGALVGVIGGRGGAGATTLATALAVTAARAGRRSMLVDADPLGGGVDLVLGGEAQGGARWPDLAASRGRLRSDSLRRALPCVDGLTVLSFARGDDAPAVPAEAMAAVLDTAARGHDLVALDLPRSLDAAAALAVSALQTVLLVVPAEVRAAIAARRVVAAVAPLCPDVRLVVRGPAPAGLEAAVIADALDLPLAGVVKAEPGLPVALERGEVPTGRGRGPLAALCRGLLEDLLSGADGRVAA